MIALKATYEKFTSRIAVTSAVAIAVLLLAMIPSTTAAADKAEGRTAAGHLAEGKLESFLGEPKLDIQQVYKGGRFPNIVVALDGSLLAVWNGVKVKRSEDGGKSWGPDILVGSGFMGGGVTVNETNGDIFAFVEKHHPPTELTVYRSQDNGKTWSSFDATINPDSNGNVPSMHMNDGGITLRHGKHAGRIIRPSRHYAGKNDRSKWPEHYTNAIYSDDGGKTWNTSDPFPAKGTGEATLAELSDGRIYYNSRRHWAPEGVNPRRRWTAFSDDGGKSWKGLSICEILPDGPQNTNYGCMGGLVRLAIKGKDILVYSNPDSPSGRNHGTLWVSFDGGKSWPMKRLVTEGSFGYSSITAGRPETNSEGWIYVHYESGGSKVARLNLSWLLAGEKTGDGTVPDWVNRKAVAQEEPIFSNDRFVFYKDRLETRDFYKGVYRSTQGLAITKDGKPGFKWNGFRKDKLYLQTPYPILDATFAYAVDETLGCIAPAGTKSAVRADYVGPDKPGGKYYRRYYYYTHGKDIREYTRDTALHVHLGDSVIIDRDAAEGTIIRRFDFERKRIREAPVYSVHLISAVLEFYRITGDKDFLRKVWDCMWNEMSIKEAARKKNDGLWTGAPWVDHPSGYVKPSHFGNRNVKSLHSNALAAGAWQSLADMAGVLGLENEQTTANRKYLELKAAINKVLYRPELGTYCYYKHDQSYYDYREDISAGFIYLFGIADKKQTLDYHSKFTATPYGYRNVDPVVSKETEWMGGNVWDIQEAYHGWALAKLDRPDEFKNFIFWHARAGLIPDEWVEGTINPSTGQLNNNYKRFTCATMAYTSYWTRGVFGIIYDVDGIRFDPCVPTSFTDAFYAVLNNFAYRDCSLQIILRGKGCKLARVLLDGKQVTVIPGDLKGQHTVEVFMKNHVNTAIPKLLHNRNVEQDTERDN